MNDNAILNSNEISELDDNGGFKYKFSIVMAVYNVSKFINEAIDSVLNQTIGFEKNVQLILVDDGSPDDSGEKCDYYKSLYPNNIVVIHKENGGVCSARNEGLKYIEGRYVDFMDPDDIITSNALEKVYDFFDKHDSFVDMVSIPVYFFGDQHGQHHLNNKFNKGTRIINLQKEYQHVMVFCNSGFVKNHIAKKMVFNSKLVVGEDFEQVLRILMNNHNLGVVTECKYLYRRRDNSLITSGMSKKGWYTDYVKYLSKSIFDSCLKKFGYIPKYIQSAVLCDLQWRLRIKEAPSVLSSEELVEYKALLKDCLSKIDNDLIMMQKNIPFDTKVFIISQKYAPNDFISVENGNILYGFDSENFHKFSNNTLQLCFLEVTKEKIFLSLRQSILNIGDIKLSNMLIKLDNEDEIRAKAIKVVDSLTSIGQAVSKYAICDFEIDRDLLNKSSSLSFYSVIDEDCIIKNWRLKSGTFFPIETKYKNAYCYDDGLIFKIAKERLIVSSASKRQKRKAETKFQKELWKSNKLGERKAVFARILARIYKLFHRKPIWIISDRMNKAGDNGEAFFRHLKAINFKGAHYFYAINKCPNYYDMKGLGNIINRSSIKYKVMHLAADLIISSHADHFVIDPFDYYSQPYKDILATKKFIFLQHGITRNDISGWLNRYNKNIRGFICAAQREKDSIINGTYYYPESRAWLTGFARFDRLYHDEKKYITIMPTWRRYLMADVDSQTGIWNEGATFKNSEYFKFYNSLINDKRLIDAADKCGYTICYMPHPNIITKAHLFDHNEKVKFFTIDDEYKDVYAWSDLVLTDYSSAFFDFAYLRKPVLYAEFDRDRFYDGNHVCTEGYFVSARDGFGEVAYDYESTVNLLIEYMENGCKLKDKYRERIDSFFAFNDKNNCQRILDKILEL